MAQSRRIRIRYCRDKGICPDTARYVFCPYRMTFQLKKMRHEGYFTYVFDTGKWETEQSPYPIDTAAVTDLPLHLALSLPGTTAVLIHGRRGRRSPLPIARSLPPPPVPLRHLWDTGHWRRYVWATCWWYGFFQQAEFSLMNQNWRLCCIAWYGCAGHWGG